MEIQKMELGDGTLTEKAIGCALEVHRLLGPGLLEFAYRKCLYYGLRLNRLIIEQEKPMPIVYKEINLDRGYRIDLLIEKQACSRVENRRVFH